jgi:hypothetical protein
MDKERAAAVTKIFEEEGIPVECVIKPGTAKIRAVTFVIDGTRIRVLGEILEEFKDLKLRMDQAPEGVTGERVYLW